MEPFTEVGKAAVVERKGMVLNIHLFNILTENLLCAIHVKFEMFMRI